MKCEEVDGLAVKGTTYYFSPCKPSANEEDKEFWEELITYFP
jgi:hypothetical protein